MAKRIPLVFSSSKQVPRRLHSSLPSISILSTNTMCFSTAYPHAHAQGSDTVRKTEEVVESIGKAAKDTVETAWDATKKTVENVTETITAEADTNVVDTVEYRSSEDLKGQLGDGCDKIELK
ncbi:chilling-induced protein [Senna tora]|uniref:Chilling-induced protein n=1 Tax=Senna tora TaxID=362788 RepID=A0A834TJZ7_9FABA|nr:chilling-induced protein [Senna tora]